MPAFLCVSFGLYLISADIAAAWLSEAKFIKDGKKGSCLDGNIRSHAPSSFYFVLVSSEASSHRPKRYHISPTVLFCSIHLAINLVLLKGCSKLRPLPYWEAMCLCVEAFCRLIGCKPFVLPFASNILHVAFRLLIEVYYCQWRGGWSMWK